METRKDRSKKRKKRRGPFRLIRNAVLLVIVAVVGYAAYLYFLTGSIFSKSYEDDWKKSDLREERVDPTKDNVSVLIIGVDESDKRSGMGSYRSDTLMLATLNKKTNSVKLLSIPRDSYVYIKKVGYKTRINHAYAFGGTTGAIETVEDLLEVPVDYYVKVNFEAFMGVVDALGGITVDVPYEFKEQNSKDKAGAIHLMPGKQVLDGEEALALARTRKKDNDIERGKRQQEIIKAIVEKAASLKSVLKYDDMLQVVGENMKTNITFGEMRSFLSYGLNSEPQIESLNLKGSDDWSTGAYYYKLDEESLAETKEVLRKHLEL
ncbi:LCP family protein [Bacillus andreraoultii]|uniref:LCP family protein n=1 Tax=Bacillus andreraoultii TaxID=1499685 RepID=UPI000539897E|nr:LCP family protein [Bacillus andreraoultii]